MQRGGGSGGEGSQSQSQPQYGVVPAPPQDDMIPPATAALTTHMSLGAATEQQQQQQVVEEASPISSRPPAIASTSTMSGANLDEFMRLSAAAGGGIDEDEADRGGGGASGNRWPRQETLALLQIRSDMDVAFRDATLKGPLWEDVSRKLAEMGYKRSAKKCKEKFENVHKYYKRTKEGRAGRQDGKSYRFFSQLEALHNISGTVGAASATSASNINLSAAAPPHQPITAPTASTLDVAPVSVGIPMPMSSSVRIPTPHHQPQPPATTAIGVSSSSLFPAGFGAQMAPEAPGADASVGISFSSDGSSSPSSEDGNNDDEMMDGRPSNAAVGSSRKRKRQSSSSSSKGETRRMMEFFEGLMKQVMQKQEAMQQRFLEAIEKREQDRMIRDEAWKRQEIARLSREHELMAQERAISASRDAAIVSFLQKITGQTVQLPSLTTIPTPQPQPPPPQPPEQQAAGTVAPLITVTTHPQVIPSVPQPQLQATPSQAPRQQQDKIQQQHHQVHHHHQRQTPISSDIVLAVPEQQVPPQQESASGGSLEPTSSRWPKVEVLALIKLRSGLESRYQEAGPKGPLWEEISAGMQRMGYNRSSKRCKEKWENINKYFKKVKESNKKRPDDAKTCPYFHELDALYKRKVLGGSTSIAGGSTPSSGFASQQRVPVEQQPPQAESMILETPTFTKLPDRGDAAQQPNKNEGNGESANKPEDIVKELIQQQVMQPHGQQEQQLRLDDYDHKMEEVDSDNLDQDEEDEYDEEEDGDEDDEELQEERKMAYKIEFQRQNTNATDGGGSGAAPSFLAMVQ